MIFEAHPTPAPAPERVERPLCATRTGTLWLPQAPGQRWLQIPVRDIRGHGWVMAIEGPIPAGLPEVESPHEVDFGSTEFARGFVVARACNQMSQ